VFLTDILYFVYYFVCFVQKSKGRGASIVGVGSRLRSERRRNHPASYSIGKGTFPSGGKVAAVMGLTTKYQLALRLRMRGTIPLVSLYALMARCLIR
jgi:hypothetical protein